MTETKSRVFRFADIEVREREFVLVSAGAILRVEPKAFRVLLFLLRNPGRLVTKQEIIDAVWNDCSVSDNSLTKSIATLRRVLEDDSREPRYIATVQTVGYRFVCDVTATEEAAGPVALSMDPKPGVSRLRGTWHSYWKPITIGSAVVLTLFLAWFSFERRGFSWVTWGHSLDPATDPNLQSGPSSISRRPLTANPEDDPVTSAAISPDGKYLAYSDSNGLFLKLIDSGETHPIPLPEAFIPTVESWFPDSVHLVVSWIEDSRKPPGLWITSVLGGTPRKLTEVGSFARISPDGSRVAFLRGPWDDNEIWLVDSDGNSPRKIVDGGTDYFGPVSWSPQGTHFASVRTSVERPEGQVQIFDAVSGRAETIMSLPNLGTDIVWSSSGLLYYSLAEVPPNQGTSNLWSVRLDRRKERPVGSAIRLTDDRDRVGSITLTSDGKRLAVLRYTNQSDVFLSSIEPAHKKLSPPHRFTLDQRDDFPSSWTPDSNAVLIVSNRDGVSHIFKQKIDQTQPELLVGGRQNVWLPHMSPDASDVLYLASSVQVGPSDPVQLMSIPASGGASRLVFEDRGLVNYQCARLPSKTCVYGKAEAENYRFFSFDSSNGNRRELPIRMKKGSAMNNWNLSPDGRFLAISETQNPYEGPRLRVISLADNTQRLLSPSKLNLVVGVDWAADSRSIWLGGFIGRGWSGRSGLINVDLSGHQTLALEVRSPGILGGTPSPDGRRVALGANSFSSNVWLLQNR